MIKKYYPVKLHFDVAIEYSKDNGANWLTLPADTPINISPEELPANGRIKVRTAETIESLDPAKLEFDSRLFKAVNIKNGRTLTTTNSLFKNSTIDTIRVANIPALINAEHMFEYGIFNNIIMGYAPSVTNINNFMYRASVKAFDGIRLPVCTYADSSFREIKNNTYMGDIIFDTPVHILNGFYGAEIKVMPYIELNGFDNKGSYYSCSGLFSKLKSKYMLYSKFNFAGSSNESNLFENTELKFSGADLIVPSSSLKRYWFANSSDLIYPWSRLIKKSGEMEYIFNNSANITDDLTDTERDRIQNQSDAYVISELPNWMPEITELEAFDGIDNAIGINFTSANGLKIVSYIEKSGVFYRLDAIAIDNYDSVTYSKTIEPTFTKDNKVVYSRNGSYALQDGADVKVHSSDGALLATLDGLTIKAMNLNSNASKLFVVTGGSFDKLNMDHQTIANDIKVFDVASATQIDTYTVTLEQDEEVVGVYCPSDDSHINIVKTKWYVFDAAEMHQRMLSSTVDSYTEIGGTKYSINLTYPVNLVTNHHVEDNEFNCLDTINGKHVRIFTK